MGRRFWLSLVALFFFAGIVFASSKEADEAYSKLFDGNKRFVSGTLSQKDLGDAKRKELAKGQHPFAIVVTCSDSRVAPEIIFDQGLGELFVIRVAGNVVDPVAIGSIEYAAEHLHTPLLVILGHTQCGAVTAAVDSKGNPEGNIGAIIKKILPAVRKAKAKGGSKEEIISTAIKENVLNVEKNIRSKSPVLRDLIEKGQLKVVSAIYDISAGSVEVLR